MACTPVVIPPQPPLTVFGDVITGQVTWCDTTMTLALFVEYININLNIIVECFEETFFEEIELPGVPPITITSPGYDIPGVDSFTGERVSRAELRGRAYTGHRFPWQTGGEARAPWEFRGFPSVHVPGGSITIPGTDPMLVIMEFTQVNYQIIVERLEEHGLKPILDWSQFAHGCDIPPDLGPNNQAIIDIIPPADSIDGPPLPDSEVPTFGPGTCGPLSCWDCNGTLIDNGDGSFSVSAGGAKLKCACAITEPGAYDVGATFIMLGGFEQCAFVTATVWDDTTCTTAASISTGVCLLNPDGETTPIGITNISIAAGQALTFEVSSSSQDITGPFARKVTGPSGSPCVLGCGGSTALRRF